MSRTLTDIIQAIDSGTDLDSLELSVEEEVLAGSFVHERTERPVMLGVVVEHTELLRRYLGLPAEQRALLEGLRAKKPEYLEGDYETEPAIKSSGKTPRPFTDQSWQLYKDTHNTKAINRIVRAYIQHQPTNTHGKPIPLTKWFKQYDPPTVTNLRPEKQGKRTTISTPPANKYYARWQRKHKQKPETTPDFEKWIQDLLTTELQQQLTQTPYFQQTNITLEQTIQYYIEHQPINSQGPVPLTNWFMSYDPTTATHLKPRKEGKTTNLATPPAQKYYREWYFSHREKNSDFEAWTLAQVGPKLREQALQTPYFTQKNITLEETIQAYIQHQPTNIHGKPLPLSTWFHSYDPATATNLLPLKEGKRATISTPPARKHYQQWYALKNKEPNTPDFEQWILTQINQELRERLQQTPYYTRQHTTIEQTIEAYIQHQPTYSQGKAIPLQAWFTSYDPATATNLKPRKEGKTTTIGTPPAQKHHNQWHRNHQNEHPDFEQWILNQLTPELREQTLQTPYFTQTNITLEQAVQLYIQHQPTYAQEKAIPLQAWFTSYDPATATNLKPQKIGKKATLRTPPAQKHYNQWERLKKKDADMPDFENWALSQVSKELRAQALQTPYFTQTNITLEQVVQLYIQHQPRNNHGKPVPLTTWFMNYDPALATHLKPYKNGKPTKIGTPPANKYYQQWGACRKKEPTTTPGFETWALSQVSEELRAEALRTPYFLNKNKS